MYLVIDIGGTFVKYALMNAAGTIVTKGRRPTSTTNLTKFKNKIYSIIEDHDLSGIKGIAISCPGTIDVDTGMIYYGGSFPFLHEVNLAKEIEDKYGIDVRIENDGKCAALAELWLGSVKEAKDSVVLILGSGVGGGIIIDGKLHRGVNLSAGEVSYCMNNINPASKTGQFFGLDCSAVEMVRRIAAIKNLEDPTDGEKVFEYIKQNDEEATTIFNEYCIYLATQILNLQYILDPELFAIGGGISAQPILLERIQWALAELKKTNPMHVASPKVVACEFRNDANLYGALYHFFVSKEKLVVK
ncbi:putative NBD/HSP70 family sugar kinase [Neobacillus bataviensis]|uniref:Putative NBD/HSP70 family sugar kinase n=1 Tax=Neobacillus bataviensis TaxID=220685 RepID=A0A561E0K7_9BACI|nr:ROK family protein [Neobacillus bataviensis]TWE09122.1 putative NBD/HSP70 family sugar kinase [Neobacillus bataviensis]